MDNVTALLLLCALACAPIALILLMLYDAFGWRRAESAVPALLGAAIVFLLGALLSLAVEVLYG